LLAAMAVTTLASRVHQAVAVIVATLPVAAFLIGFAVADPDRREGLIAHRRQFVDHERIAAQLHARANAEDGIYVLVSEPDLYFLVDLPSRYPYLWGHPVLEIPGARARLRSVLASSERPEWLAVYTPPREVDPSGRLGAVIRRHYVEDRSIESRQARIYRVRAGPDPSPDGTRDRESNRAPGNSSMPGAKKPAYVRWGWG
jgi:hypothetical protein